MKIAIAKTLGLLAIIALTGCAGMTTDDSGRGTGATPVNELIASNQLPGGAKINHAQSLIMGSGENWMGRVALELPGGNAGYNFFLEQYPQQGWTLVSAVRGKSSLLVFTKADRTATVELSDGAMLGGTLAVLTVSPRNTLPAPAPARKP
jgi:hypothetical protein